MYQLLFFFYVCFPLMTLETGLINLSYPLENKIKIDHDTQAHGFHA